MAKKLTKTGALKLTQEMDRIANVIETNVSLLGLNPKVASEFVSRVELVADMIEKRAGINRDEEGNVVANETESSGGFDPSQIGETKAGPVEKESDEAYMTGRFTQERFTELHDKQVSGKLPVADKMASIIRDLIDVAAEIKR